MTSFLIVQHESAKVVIENYYQGQCIDCSGSGEVSYKKCNKCDGTGKHHKERDLRKGTKVHMEQVGGVYFVPITVNGLNLDFVFDTGASSISLSMAEATVMAKQGKITEDDVVGQSRFYDANGDISVGTVVLLRTVQIGDIILYNVEASIVDNIQAPLLLGQSALAKFGKVTIDYSKNTIEFN